ncbi:MAG: glycosyltransferase family 39 protein [Lachnospiraceae bacterium]|nr:glycosyltransferase family 39 protein [Lachnospiraceae bacterium]
MSKLGIWVKGNWKLFFIMVFAVLSRGVLLGEIPCGAHADEAFAGYEAYSLLEYGTDSWGYRAPVYLTTWGSGMSALESYLMIPFIKFGGLNLVTVRLPQLIMGVISVFVVYLLYSKISDHKKGLWAAMMIAICPWHIMMSRWGLDANLAPAFILLAMYFAVLGLSKEEYLIISALFWGMSLYCYALMWLFVPFFLSFSFLYCIKFHKVKISKYTISAAVLLFLLAVPLLLFVAVNIGLLPELKTQYISIPRLVQFRGDELSGTHILSNIKDFVRIYLKQYDYNLMNAIPVFGLYYLFSMPFMLLGAYDIMRAVWCNRKQKKFGYEIFLLIWFSICTVIGLLRSMSIYRANCMNLAVLFLVIRGSAYAGQLFRGSWIRKGIPALYIVSFCLFEGYYFTSYRDTIKDLQLAGADEALIYAVAMKKDSNYNVIHVTERLRHPQVLFYLEYPTHFYMETVEWKNYPAGWLIAESFGDFLWDTGEGHKQGVYVICSDEIDDYENAGYDITQFDACAVAFREE